jgi:hypothetical protein
MTLPVRFTISLLPLAAQDSARYNQQGKQGDQMWVHRFNSFSTRWLRLWKAKGDAAYGLASRSSPAQ